MEIRNKAREIKLFSFGTPQMRAFHLTWLAFFLCFFAWFGIAPLMPIVRQELSLSKSQVGWCIIASVSVTILARLLIGALCDWFGPRRTYTWLLVLGSLPVMGIGLAHDFETFLVFRLLIGAIGASFVITQYHTSTMFAPNCVGTANALVAGWGNLGGGVTQFAMPLLFSLFVGVLGCSTAFGWRASMFLAGAVCLLTGLIYYWLTQDAPDGDFRDLRAKEESRGRQAKSGTFIEACRDYRVWALFGVYGACFGLELTIDNIAALYFADYFGLGLTAAGIAAGAFGGMNLFARALGGWIADRCGRRWDFRGRVGWLFAVVLCEGLALILFSQARWLALAMPLLLLFGLFVKMSNGATYAVVPFINPRALGSVAGIVGAGGNAGAVAAGFLFQRDIPWPTTLLILGCCVCATSLLALLVKPTAEVIPAPVAAEPPMVEAGLALNQA